MKEFHTLTETILYLVASVTEGVAYQPIWDAAPGAAMVWFAGWLLISRIILINFLIAIVCDAFTTNQNREAKKAERTREYPAESFTAYVRRLVVQAVGGAALDSSVEQAAERVAELREALSQVDGEAMIDRLGKGIDEDEVAVDATEIANLFGVSEREARLFIDRVCSLGQLAPVVPEPTVLNEIRATARQVQNVSALLEELECEAVETFPLLNPLLYPDKYEWEESESEDPASPRSPASPRGLALRKAPRRRPPTALFAAPPLPGELRHAARKLREAQGDDLEPEVDVYANRGATPRM